MKRIIIVTATIALTFLLAVPVIAAWSGPEEMLDHKTEILAQRVEAGVITQEQSDEILSMMEERMANCAGQPAEDRQRLGQMIGGGLGFGRTGEKGTGQHRMARGNR